MKPPRNWPRPDPMPSPPAPPNPGESHEDYDKRCGPFEMVGGAWYQRSLLDWIDRQPLPPPAIKERYTLQPRPRLWPWIALIAAAIFAVWQMVA